MKNRLLAPIALLMLPGCQFLNPQSLPVQPPADLTSPCDPLPEFSGKDTKALVSYSVHMAYLYHGCEDKQTALAAWSLKINQ